MIDLGRLRALHAVASYGTVLAAGDALHCTPSAVSQQLAKLERETGSTLVEKDGRRLRLTEAGRILAGHAERVLATVDEAEAALAAHRDTVTGRLTVAAFATACRALSAVRVASSRKRAPRPGHRAGRGEPERGPGDAAPRPRRPRGPRRLAGGALHYPPGIARVELAATWPT